MIVLDASAAPEVVLCTLIGHKIESRIFATDESLHVPHLIDLEVIAVLRRYALAGEMAPARAAEALADFSDFPVERYPHYPFTKRAWSLRHNITFLGSIDCHALKIKLKCDSYIN